MCFGHHSHAHPVFEGSSCCLVNPSFLWSIFVSFRFLPANCFPCRGLAGRQRELLSRRDGTVAPATAFSHPSVLREAHSVRKCLSLGCTVSVGVHPPVCTCSPTSTHVKFLPSLINSHCPVVAFLEGEVFSACLNPPISRYPDDEEHGVRVPLGTLFWGSPQL